MWNYMKYNRKIILAILVPVLIIAGWWAWCKLYQAQPVTYESQVQAETVQGVQEAADNAGVHISQGQAAEAAQAIKEATERQPDEVIQTTGAEMPKALADSREKSGAQMQIVTDPAHPDQTPEKPAADQEVNLNVYNIKAYPKVMDQAAIYLRPDGTQPKVTGGEVSRSWRISKGGSYIGVGGSYDEDRSHGKVRLVVKYTHSR